jgi:hypothetical protein
LLTGYADAGMRLAIDDITVKDAQPAPLRKPVRDGELAECAAALLAPAQDAHLPIGTGAAILKGARHTDSRS